MFIGEEMVYLYKNDIWGKVLLNDIYIFFTSHLLVKSLSITKDQPVISFKGNALDYFENYMKYAIQVIVRMQNSVL